MKNIVIYYFSGTGNTWWLANRLKEKLDVKDNQVACYSIETLMIEDVITQLADISHVIFGFPVYGSTAPKPMLEFINLFPTAPHQQTMSVFATQALASGDTAYKIGQVLIKKGYNLKQTRHFRMMNNLHLPKFRFYPPKNDERLDQLLEITLPKVADFAQKITNDQKYITGNNPLGHCLGNLQRHFIDKLIHKASQELTVDAKRCILCGKCQRICPTANIEQTQNKVEFSDHCALCLRCYSQCPTSAIFLGEGSQDTAKYPRYKGPGKDFNVNLLIQR